MVHFEPFSTGSTISFDGREDTAIITLTGGGPPVRLELPFRSVAAVLPSGASLTTLGAGAGLDISATRVVANLIGPIGETTAAGPATLATSLVHPENVVYYVIGLVGGLRNGTFSANEIAWTFHSMNGITGNPQIPIDAVLISSSQGANFEVVWGGSVV